MAEDDDEETAAVLTEHPHPPPGLRVKLDKGFKQGIYCTYVEYDALVSQVGFMAARRQALAYGALLRGQLGRMAGHALDDTDDASHSGDPRRKYDLESTFLSFALTTDDGRWHDAAMTERFRIALLRADQQWDQAQAGVDARRRDGRREAFRHRLDTLLAGESYRQVDAATKERLLAEITALVFPPKGREL
jgi:hypothetical protein